MRKLKLAVSGLVGMEPTIGCPGHPDTGPRARLPVINLFAKRIVCGDDRDGNWWVSCRCCGNRKDLRNRLCCYKDIMQPPRQFAH